MRHSAVIYKYQNTINGKVYIGQTTNPERRKKKHVWRAKAQRFDNHFYRAIRKYGWEPFEYHILETIYSDDLQELSDLINQAEIDWIVIYDSYYNGYNSTFGGGGMLGYKRTEESIRKSAESRHKPVLQYSLEGEFIKKWDSILDAARYLKTNKSSISQCVLFKRKTCKGFIWRRYEGGDIPKKIEVNLLNAASIPVLQINKNTGEVIKEWPSTRIASEEVGVDSSGIVKACKGKLKTTGGFKWQYK